MSVQKIPIHLLKTKSTPTDRYEEYFNSIGDGTYSPGFIPVLEHQFIDSALGQIRSLLSSGGLLSGSQRQYGGVIFTSQRAAEAFTDVFRGFNRPNEIIDERAVIYVVGPATKNALTILDASCPLLGEETGNGDALAAFILDDYNIRWQNAEEKPGLLFLTGEKHRDVIPKTLQTESLPLARRISVTELEVYKTIEHPEFENAFRKEWSKAGDNEQWVVVFSPSGCQTVLKILGLLDETSGKHDRSRRSSTKIATIGPTTKAFMLKKFGFEPHVCAPSPSPEGVGDAIHSYRNQTVT
jgi:uroporphyrinogen-III synthase